MTTPTLRHGGGQGVTGDISRAVPILETARLRLRGFRESDLEAQAAVMADPDVTRHLGGSTFSREETWRRILCAPGLWTMLGFGYWAVEDGEGRVIGFGGLMRLRRSGGGGEEVLNLYYRFEPDAWGHGYATEAVHALLKWAFDTLDLNRVQAETDTRNAASARVLEKLGFVREGTMREDCVVNGEVSDSWVYGLIRREWRPSSEAAPAR